MSKKNTSKLIVLNLAVIIVGIILKMNPFTELAGAAFALWWTGLIMCGVAFLYGNYSLLFQNPTIKLFSSKDLIETDDFFTALDNCSVKKVFDTPIVTTIDQLHRIENKEKSLNTILLQYFTRGEMTYNKFQTVILSTRSLFNDNVKKIINRITIFDDIEYRKLVNQYGTNLKAHVDENPKVKIYQEHIDYVNTLVENNENVLTKYDALLLEISKLDDVDNTTFEQLQAIEEMNNLIATTKYYKED